MSVETPDLPPPPAPPEPHRTSLVEKVAAVLFCIFCFEVGLFLIVYPMLDTWGRNHWFSWRREWHDFLVSSSFRGAVIGLGILNVFVGLRETLRLRHLR